MNFEYILTETGEAVLTKVSGFSEREMTVEVPAVIDGHTITEIGENFVPFGEKTKVREVILPNTIKKIRSRAFNDMRYLKKLVLPKSVTEIEDFGIFTCPDLTELFVPSSVTDFGRCAFGYMYEHGRAYRLNYFTLLCAENSASRRFAEENNLKYRLL